MEKVKKEAERLIKKYYETLYTPFLHGVIEFYNHEKLKKVKKCALICLDEKIKALENYQETVQFASNELISVEPDWYFYKQVKQYIKDSY